MLKQKHQFFVALLCLTDGLVTGVACILAWLLRQALCGHAALPADWRVWVKEPLLPVVVPVTLLALWAFGVYRPRRDRTMWGETLEVLKAATVAVVGVIVLFWALGPDARGMFGMPESLRVAGLTLDAARFQLAAIFVVLAFALAVHRLCFRVGLRAIRRRGWNLRHVAIVGVGRLGRIACRTIERNGWTGINVMYFLSHREKAQGTQCMGRPVLGGVADLERVLDDNKPDAIYLAIPNSQAAMLPGLLRRLERFAVDVRIIPDVHPRYLPQSMAISELDGMPVLSYRENPHHGVGGFAKRVLDAFGSLAAIIVLSPLMLAVASAVRASSPGPVIFRQRRVSLGGQVFNIYKFRTMFHVEDEQSPASWTRRDDPRVTPVGRWLRRASLDELPQLFNVLFGDMSLVGPRPERPELIESFRDNWRGYVLRQHVKAGITGWAQVNGLRGDTDLRKRLQHDLFYIRHWSLGFDLKILWLTVFRGFVHPNAH